MAQYARPDADIIVSVWTTAPLWSKVDEGATGDGTRIVSDSSPIQSEACVLRLSDITDPVSATGHIIRAKWRDETASGADLLATAELREGYVSEVSQGTLIATLQVTISTHQTDQTDTYGLSAGETNSIGDYTDLFLRLHGVKSGGGSNPQMGVDFCELETPDAASVIEADSSDGIKHGDGAAVTVTMPAACSDGIKWGDDAVGVATELAAASDGIKWGESVTGVGTELAAASDGLKWGDSTAADVLIIASCSDGIKWGENFLTVTYEQFAGDGLKLGESVEVAQALGVSVSDGIKWGDDAAGVKGITTADASDGLKWGDSVAATAEMPVALTDGLKIGESVAGDATVPVAASDGIKYGDTTDAIVSVGAAASDGLKWGDLAQVDRIYVGLVDGIKWGDWGTQILGFQSSSYPASVELSIPLSIGDKIPSTYSARVFAIHYYISSGSGNNVRVAIYTGTGIWPNIPFGSEADLLKDYGVFTTLAGWNVVYDGALSLIPAGSWIWTSFKTNDGSTLVPATSQDIDWKHKWCYGSVESNDETDPWDDPYPGLDSGIWGKTSVWVEILVPGPLANVATAVIVTDGIKWGETVLATYDESILDGIKWGDSPAAHLEITQILVDGIVWGDLAATVGGSAGVGVTDGIKWGDYTVEDVAGKAFLSDGYKWGEDFTTVTRENFDPEGIKWGDSVEAATDIYNVYLVDGWKWGENFDLVITENLDPEGIKWGETVFVNSAEAASVTDGIKWGDATEPYENLVPAAASNGIKWGESLDPVQQLILAVSDGWKLGGAVAEGQAILGEATDGIKWGDRCEVDFAFLTDGIKWGDFSYYEGEYGEIGLMDAFISHLLYMNADIEQMLEMEPDAIHRLTMKPGLEH
jgi:hypothetical protein